MCVLKLSSILKAESNFKRVNSHNMDESNFMTGFELEQKKYEEQMKSFERVITNFF